MTKIPIMKSTTIARGYRLRASTHMLIKKIQAELNLNQDKVIRRAVKMYYDSIKNPEAYKPDGKN